MFRKIHIWLAGHIDELQAVLITFILFNFTMLYATEASYSDDSSPINLVDKIWFTTDGGMYPLAGVCFFYFNKGRILKYVWLTLGIFFAIRWLCEIAVFTCNTNVNTPKPIIAFLFYLSFAAIVIITFLPFIIRAWHFFIKLWKILKALWKSL